MTTTTIRVFPSPGAASVKLYPLTDASGVPAVAGYSLALVAGTQSQFTATIDEALIGDFYYEALGSGGEQQGRGYLYGLNDTAGPYFENLAAAVSVDADAIAASVLDGLESMTVVRLGPDFDPATKCIKLQRGNDYSVAKLRSIAFGISLPGINLVGAVSVFVATNKYHPNVQGTAEILDAETEDPKIRLSWTQQQTTVEVAVYKYTVDIKDSDGEVATVLKGNFHIV